MCGFASIDGSRCVQITQKIFFWKARSLEMILNTYIMVKKIQIDDFKRILSKKHVKKRSGPVFGPFRGGIYGMSP